MFLLQHSRNPRPSGRWASQGNNPPKQVFTAFAQDDTLMAMLKKDPHKIENAQFYFGCRGDLWEQVFSVMLGGAKVRRFVKVRDLTTLCDMGNLLGNPPVAGTMGAIFEAVNEAKGADALSAHNAYDSVDNIKVSHGFVSQSFELNVVAL